MIVFNIFDSLRYLFNVFKYAKNWPRSKNIENSQNDFELADRIDSFTMQNNFVVWISWEQNMHKKSHKRCTIPVKLDKNFLSHFGLIKSSIHQSHSKWPVLHIPIGTCYLCTFPRTIKTGIGTCCGSSIHSFHLKSEF